ncbi:hypothetical protein HYDPIDRAFT_29501 [Hydnomerulius pinastri MD-312]|uniref:Uncharacterized protein n=1 Tax=Hydnomerulius pinastri MD-312 TaxID=994086 RepID=A0A0C9W7N0_9AGAM|nr:hypothetical protein HYDPIDRAFT_29501 [Hydnomerulius pinastri MD-312]
MSDNYFLQSPLGPGMDRCWTEVTIDLNIIGAASDLRNILEHFPPENLPRLRRIFWHRIQTLMDATTALIGQATLLGLNPTSHPILQYVARNAAAMEAEGFDIADIPPFEWDLADSAYCAIVMAPADAWWEDLHVLREDRELMNWQYMPNMRRNHQFWDLLKEISEQSVGHNIPSQVLLCVLYNIRNGVTQTLAHVDEDIENIEADIEATTQSLSQLLSQALEESMSTVAEIRSWLGQDEDGFWAERFRELDEIIAQGNAADA